jgi:predicted  nucleic acid-binding Zn-ribbon protein
LRLNAELEAQKAKIDTIESDLYQKEAQNELKLSTLSKQIDLLTKEKTRLEYDLESGKRKYEEDTKKLESLVTEYSKDKPVLNEIPTSTSNNNQIIKPQIQVYDYLRQSSNGVLNILENLQSKLQEKDGEIVQLQKNINDLERIRESLAKELVNLSNKVDILESQLSGYPQLEENYKVISN